VGVAVCLAVRLLVPLLIFRRPLVGGVLSIVADFSDLVIFNIWGWPEWDYQQFDKLLDVYYLTIELAAAQRFERLPRLVADGLFAWRLIGVLAFELTGWRPVLMVFPNLFEPWFLLVVATARFRPGYRLTGRRTAAWLAVLAVPKLVHEYLLHVARALDDVNLFDLVGDWWPG
jgi:hypothetical protein